MTGADVYVAILAIPVCGSILVFCAAYSALKGGLALLKLLVLPLGLVSLLALPLMIGLGLATALYARIAFEGISIVCGALARARCRG